MTAARAAVRFSFSALLARRRSRLIAMVSRTAAHSASRIAFRSSQKTDIPVDVVLSEINIPGAMNGFGLAQWARSVRPELQILLAGTPGRTVQNAAQLCEAGPLLMKPYDHKIVLDRIKRLLAARARQGRR